MIAVRQQVLDAADHALPERLVRRQPQHPPLAAAVGINWPSTPATSGSAAGTLASVRGDGTVTGWPAGHPVTAPSLAPMLAEGPHGSTGAHGISIHQLVSKRLICSSSWPERPRVDGQRCARKLLHAARRNVSGGISWQRCQFYLQQNAHAYVPKQKMQAEVVADIRAILTAPSRMGINT